MVLPVPIPSTAHPLCSIKEEIKGVMYSKAAIAAAFFPFMIHSCTCTMTIVDRWKEFQATTQGLKLRIPSDRSVTYNQSGLYNITPDLSNKLLELTRNIVRMDVSIEKLVQATTSKGTVIVPQDEQHWTRIVKSDITNINDQFKQLSQLGITTELNPSVEEHVKQIIKLLQIRFANSSSTFKDTLQFRSDRMLATKQRREQLGAINSQVSEQQFQVPRPRVIPDNIQTQESIALQISSTDDSQQRLLERATDMTTTYHQSRNVALESIETAIQELGYIFSHLAHLVSIQGETVQRIDTDIEEAQIHVEHGQEELLKYWRYISNNRWLLVKCFAILIAFIVLFSVLFA